MTKLLLADALVCRRSAPRFLHASGHRKPFANPAHAEFDTNLLRRPKTSPR